MDRTTIENQECGIRHHFNVVYRDRSPNAYPDRMAQLIRWCRIFDEEGLAPVVGGASAGNLSFRTPPGFVITPSRSRLKADLHWTKFVEVVRSDWLDYTLHVLGPTVPSSDSFLHERVYAHRLDVEAVFHGHDDLVLKHADALAKEFPIVVTEECRLFGTHDDATATARELGSASYIIRKGHGFVAVGRTLDEAGEWSLKVHHRAVQLG